jgi:hypothetical protein
MKNAVSNPTADLSIVDTQSRRKKSDNFYDLVGQAYQAFNENHLKKAEKLFEQVTDIKRDSPNYYQALAEIKHALGKELECIQALKKSIAQHEEDPPKYKYSMMLRVYRNLITKAIVRDKQNAIDLMREMMLSCSDYISKKDLKLFSSLVADKIDDTDREAIRSVSEKSNMARPPFNADHNLPIELVDMIKTKYKPGHARFIENDGLLWIARLARPPQMQLVSENSTQWLVKMKLRPRTVLTCLGSIVLFNQKYSLAENSIEIYSTQGQLKKQILLPGHAIKGLLSMENNSFLAYCYYYGEPKEAKIYLFTGDGRKLWEWGCGRDTFRVAPYPKGWIIAVPSNLLILDDLGKIRGQIAIEKFKQTYKRLGISFGDAENESPHYNDFTTLGIEPTNDKEIIKAAFRTQALTWHPDVNADEMSTQRMQEINLAYERLANATIRPLSGEDYYEVEIDDYVNSILTHVTGKVSWITCNSGRVYRIKDGKLLLIYKGSDSVDGVALFGNDSDTLLLLEASRGLCLLRGSKLYEVKGRKDYSVGSFLGSISLQNNNLILLRDGTRYLYVLGIDGILNRIKFNAWVDDVDYSLEKDLLAIAADNIYLLRIGSIGTSYIPPVT